MSTILITSGAGFIGSILANFLSTDNRIIVIDDLSMGKKIIYLLIKTFYSLKTVLLTKIRYQ